MTRRTHKRTNTQTHLPPQIFVIHVADEERLRRESIRLHVDIRTGDVVHERRLADVGVPGENECPRVGVDGWKPAQVLAHLLQEAKVGFLALQQRCHTTQSGSFQLLAAVQRIT